MNSSSAPAVLLEDTAPTRVTFDTNVLLSLFVFADSRFAPLRGELEAGRWQALTSAPCLAEFKRVLAYPLFALSDERQAAAFRAYLDLVSIIDGVPARAAALPQCQDKDDQKFLELARDGLAHLLVTADKALLKLRRGQRLTHLFHILTPDEALALTPGPSRPPPHGGCDCGSLRSFVTESPRSGLGADCGWRRVPSCLGAARRQDYCRDGEREK